MRILAFVSLLFLFLVSKSWISLAHDQIPAPAQEKPILLINGTIHTVSGETLENSQLLFDQGKISAVDREIDAPQDCEVIDLAGKHVYPGLISSISSVGLVEISAVNATVDLGEFGPFNPNLRAQVAVNPDSEVIPVTRANGILTAHVTPTTYRGGIIAGKTAVISLDGWTTEDLAVHEPAGMSISWPRDPGISSFHPDRSGSDNPQKAEEAYAETIKKLSDYFDEAAGFQKTKETGKQVLPVDLRLEALAPVLNGDLPVHIYANTARQIRDAIQWTQKRSLRMVLMSGRDAWRVVDLLKAHDIPVVVGGVNVLPSRRWEAYHTPFTNTAILHEAGVTFAIAYTAGGPNAANERNLPYEAGKAVAHGLPEEEALKAVTLYPAEILGVADRLGSLTPGKDATLIITSGDPLDIRTQIESAFIQGRPVDLNSRHTQLYQKYQERYRQQ